MYIRRSKIGVGRRALFTIGSLALHGIALSWLAATVPTSFPLVPQPAPIEPVEVVPNDRMADIDLDVDSGERLVRTEEVNNADVSQDTPYLSHKNQIVAKNQRAQSGDKFARRGDGNEVFDPSALTPGTLPESLSLSDLGIEGQKPGRRWQMDPKFLSPSFEGNSDSYSSTDDHLPELPFGLRTLLSTKEYRFHLYLERIRESVTRPWRGDVERRLAALLLSGRPVTPGKDLITKLWLTLDAKGNLGSVAVTKSSGSRTIDLAAENVFRTRSPFPNPPKGLAGADGFVHLRWTFVLKVEASQIAAHPSELSTGPDRL